MKICALVTFLALSIGISAFGQKTLTSGLEFSGSVDAYYKYDFSGNPNIQTSFAQDQNSVSLGMIDLGLKKTTGKTSFLAEVSFGPRGQYASLPTGDGTVANGDNNFNIQNLFISYAWTEKLSMTAGYISTFIGYEVISPVGDMNYSTSYLFSSGPFQNAGIKANYKFSDKVSLMVGLFDDWNVYKDANGVSHFGAQLSLTPIEGWTANLNMLTGKSVGVAGTGSIYDLTTTYQLSEKFKLGFNAADYTISNKNGGYSGAALYLQHAFTPDVSLGLRTEYFETKAVLDVESYQMGSVTLSANLKSGGLTLIPELRMDKGNRDKFLKSNMDPTKMASQFLIAAVYAFEE